MPLTGVNSAGGLARIDWAGLGGWPWLVAARDHDTPTPGSGSGTMLAADATSIVTEPAEDAPPEAPSEARD